MADWEKVNFQKTSKDYKSDPVAVDQHIIICHFQKNK